MKKLGLFRLMVDGFYQQADAWLWETWGTYDFNVIIEGGPKNYHLLMST